MFSYHVLVHDKAILAGVLYASLVDRVIFCVRYGFDSVLVAVVVV